MFKVDMPQFDTKMQQYRYINTKLLGLLESDPAPLSNLCNSSALFFAMLQKINWVGFYLVKNDLLLLGPFQGKPACVSISMGQGVCGTAALTQKTQRVADVFQFPGHIACDETSRSEIVLPILHKKRTVAVLDIDSPFTNRFDEKDEQGLSLIVKTLQLHVDWDSFCF